MKILSKINWINTLFLTITPIVAIIGTAFLLIHGMVAWQTWVLFVLFMGATGMSITMGYHRLFAHKTYKTAWPIRLIYALLGAACFEGSILEWSTDHRNHHRYTDTDRDPYDIKRGFWFAHIGWLFTLDTTKRDFSNVEDLMQDPIVRWQHRYFIIISIVMSFVVPMLIASLWGNAWAGLVVAGMLRMVLNHHGTFCINSVCHIFGKRTYSEEQSARDNWVTALFTYGEGYHNFHHQFPLDYRNGVRFYDFDPAKWGIRMLQSVGLASELKRVSQEKIIKYRVRNDEHRLGDLIHSVSQAAKPIYDRILQLIHQIEELEKTYKQLKAEKLHSVSDKLDEYHIRLKELRRELKDSFSMWKKLQHST
ncbi:MAG: fatty acid desaturase [Gammaproteobacteria bacterium]|nr:fatty acid desaturase [Gammaproteobacteria bacterium]MCH9743622.1 fatty acid desaturase [Gammaproteobacteria bacterium]